MEDNRPPKDVQKQQPAVVDVEAITAIVPNNQPKAALKKPEGAFKRFISGPYFEIIPPQFEHHAQKQRQREEQKERQPRDAPTADVVPDDEQQTVVNYLEKLKTIVMNPVDTDDKYGLNREELVPLPFDAPMWHVYLLDILAGVYLVSQATVVMFIAIYVENQERAWKSGSSYTHSWYPLVKALVIIYPLFTLLILVSLTIEYAVRKFIYFRLLSMRILVDWKNYEPWQTIFFYYFLVTWFIMNAWAIYGVAKYYNRDGNSGVDPVSFGTFIVVNLQTIQLFLYYFKVLSTESRLVSLNQIFERAPVEAQRLLEFTYVIEEDDLIDELYLFAVNMQRVFLRRLINISTCTLVARDWSAAEKKVRIDIDRLKHRAANYKEVERNVNDLKRELEASGFKSQGTEVPKPAEQTAGAEEAAQDRSPSVRITTPPFIPPEVLTLFGLRPLRRLYRNWYALMHSLHVSVMVSFPSWPFRPDSPYFRMFTMIHLFSIFGVGAIVVLGWVYSTSSSNCTKSTKTCNTCLMVHERYFSTEEPLCSSFENAITKIVASANGTWKNTLTGKVEERYCNWACYGNFTPSGPSCPSLPSSPALR